MIKFHVWCLIFFFESLLLAEKELIVLRKSFTISAAFYRKSKLIHDT